MEIDPETGTYKPWLADEWHPAPDGRSWTVKLHQGVQFHHGYGEFTAKDVVHNHALWCDPNYAGRKDPPTSGYRSGICAVERIAVVNDYEIVMHCNPSSPPIQSARRLSTKRSGKLVGPELPSGRCQEIIPLSTYDASVTQTLGERG